jgi:hypothetical protein
VGWKAGADSHLCELAVSTATKSVQIQPFLCTLMQHTDHCMLAARCMHAICTPCTLYETDQACYPAMRHLTYSACEAASPWRQACPPQGVYPDGPRSAWCISAPSAAGCPRARRPPQPPSRPWQSPVPRLISSLLPLPIHGIGHGAGEPNELEYSTKQRVLESVPRPLQARSPKPAASKDDCEPSESE